MDKRKLIDEFLACKNPVILRYSHKTKIRGLRIEDELVPKGYTVSLKYLVNDEPTAPLSDIVPVINDAVIISIAPRYAAQAVKEVIAANLTRVWFQKGSESPEAIALCNEHGISAIIGECILMYAEPVKSVHAFHRGISKLVGKYAR